MGDQGDGVILLQFHHQLLYPASRNRVECRARLVEQQHFRLGGDSAGNTQPLLLATGERQATDLELVLDFIPQRRALQGVLDAVAQVAFVAVQAQAEGDVVEDAHGKRVRLLEHHADVTAHHHRVYTLAIYVLTQEMHVALEAKALHQVVHAVEAAQYRTFAAAGRADETGDLVFLDRHMAVTHRHEIAVENPVQLAVHDHRRLGDKRSGYLRS